MAERRGNQPHPRQFEAFFSPDMDRAMSQLPPFHQLAHVTENLDRMNTPTVFVRECSCPPPASATDNAPELSPDPPKQLSPYPALIEFKFPPAIQFSDLVPRTDYLENYSKARKIYLESIDRQRQDSICSASTGDSTDDTTRSSGSGSSSRSLGN